MAKNIMDKLLVFIFGLIIGSFLNVCIYRLPKNESIISPASRCPKCGKDILWYDNIPILSYLLLMGRCRSCKARISFRYFIVELLTAALLTLLFMKFGLSAKFLAYCVLTCSLITATFVDFEIQEIPDQVSIGAALAGLVFALIFPSAFGAASRSAALSNSFLGILAGGASIYAMGAFGKLLFKKEAMGGGDVKLMAAIGAFLGWKLVLLAFFMAPFLSAPVGIILKMKDGRGIIPYGPYLSLAALVAIFFGERILKYFFGGLF